jgi:uncharacterized protein YdcH (DUF465 family)
MKQMEVDRLIADHRAKVRAEVEELAHKIIRSLEDRIKDLERTVAGYQVKEDELRKANLALKERLIELGVDYRELI